MSARPPAAGIPRRETRQRAAVAGALGRVDGFRTAQEIHDLLRATGDSVGLTTVYRTLQRLADAGQVDILQSDEGEAMYRRCRRDDHHHHLVCRACRRTVEVEGSEVEDWAAQTARHHGFSSPTHVVEVFGLCERCTPA